MIRLCVLVLALALLVPGLAGASASVDLELDPPNPQAGELFRVRYGVRIRNESEARIAPLDFGNLEVLSDPSAPNLPMMWGAGFAISIDTANEYTLRAPRPGRYVISNARVLNTAGRVIAQHPGLTIVIGTGVPGVVLDGGEPQEQFTPQVPLDPDAPPVGDLTNAEYNPNGFVRIGIDPPRPYLGQQVTLRAWLYVASAEAQCEVPREPGLTGFWNESLLPLSRDCAARWFTQNIGGRYMTVGLIRKIAIFPSQTGRLTITGMVVNADMISGGIFRQIQRIETRSPDVIVEVREPPLEGRPANYIPGTTGPITLTAEIDRDDVSVGETVTVTVRAVSDGSLASATIQPPANIDGLRIRTGGSARSTHDSSTGRVITTMVSELLLVPERAGSFDLGHLELPYWDPFAERYEIARADVPRITARGAALPHDGAGSTTDPATVFRPLITDPSLRPHTTVFTHGRAAPFVIFAPPLAIAFAALARALGRTIDRRRKSRAEEQRTDPTALVEAAQRALARNRVEAISLAGRALDRALAAVEREVDGGFAGLPFEVRGVTTEAREACEAARFAGADADAQDLVARVDRAVRAIEAVG